MNLLYRGTVSTQNYISGLLDSNPSGAPTGAHALQLPPARTRRTPLLCLGSSPASSGLAFELPGSGRIHQSHTSSLRPRPSPPTSGKESPSALTPPPLTHGGARTSASDAAVTLAGSRRPGLPPPAVGPPAGVGSSGPPPPSRSRGGDPCGGHDCCGRRCCCYCRSSESETPRPVVRPEA